MKSRLFHLIVTVLWVPFFPVQSQTDYVNHDFIDLTFEGGMGGYMDYFEQNLDFPKNSYLDQIEGLLLFSFTVDTEKQDIDITFYTKLDERIEASVRETVQGSRSKWTIRTPGKYTVYQPIIFSLLPYYPETLEGDLPPLPNALPKKYLQLFVLIKSRRVPPTMDANFDNNTGAEATDKQKTMYVRTQKAYEKSLEAGRNETAYQLLNKLIRYHPLRKDYLMKRIELEKALEVNDYQVYDAMLLNDFVATWKPLSSYENARAGYYGEGGEPGPAFENVNIVILKEAYEGGYLEFLKDFARFYQLPSVQYIIKESGVLLLEMKSDSEGQINARLLTTFDGPASKGLENALKIMSGKWKQVEEPYHKIWPLYFSAQLKISEELAPLLEGYGTLKSNLFLEPMEMSGLGMQTVLKNETVPEAKLESLKQSSKLYKNYVAALKAYESELEKGKLRKAGEALSEAIKLNPFSIELIQKRLAINDKKIQARYGKYDDLLLEILMGLK